MYGPYGCGKWHAGCTHSVRSWKVNDMSPVAVSESTVAAAGEVSPGSSMTDDRTAKKTSRPFAKTPALADALETIRADNVSDTVTPPGKPPSIGKVDSASEFPSETAPAARGRRSELDALAQAAGWHVQSYPGSPQLAQGQPAGAASGSVPTGGQSGLRGAMPQLASAKGLKNSSPTTTGDKETTSRRLVRDVLGNSTSQKSLAVAGKRADGLKRAGADMGAESSAERLAKFSKSRVSTAEQSRQPGSKKIGAVNSKPLSQEPRDGQPNSQQVHSQTRQVMGVTVATTGAKDVGSSDPSAGLVTQPEPAASESGGSATVSRLASNQGAMTGGSGGAAAKDSAQSVGEQIRDSMQAGLARGERQLTIRLRPPELGSVLVRFREENNQIHGVLEVARADTRQEVEQALPQVLRSLQDFGIQIRRFEVTLADQSEKNPVGQQASEDARPQHEGRDQRAHGPEGSTDAGWSVEGVESQDSLDGARAAPGAGTSSQRIDILV